MMLPTPFHSAFQPPSKVGSKVPSTPSTNPLPTPVCIYPHTPMRCACPWRLRRTPRKGGSTAAVSAADLVPMPRLLGPWGVGGLSYLLARSAPNRGEVTA